MAPDSIASKGGGAAEMEERIGSVPDMKASRTTPRLIGAASLFSSPLAVDASSSSLYAESAPASIPVR
jgi:hypothetical protein